MIEPLTLLSIAAGLILLVVGSDRLVSAASGLALHWGISPLVIGLTVVAYGTSTPELAVSAFAALRGSPDVVMGNVVGSNIFNMLFILGLCALLMPLTVCSQIIKLDVPLSVAACVFVWVLGLDGRLTAAEGAGLLSAAAVYTVCLVRKSRTENRTVRQEYEESLPRRDSTVAVCLRGTVIGLALLAAGTKLFVDGAVAVARQCGLSELLIGLTLVAAGTSLPEVFTSLVATLRGQKDIAVGNVIGSTLYNLLVILGVSALISPSAGLSVSSELLRYDIPLMSLVALACAPVVLTGKGVSRTEGAALLVCYGLYVSCLYQGAVKGSAVGAWQMWTLTGVLPFLLLVSRPWVREPALSPRAVHSGGGHVA